MNTVQGKNTVMQVFADGAYRSIDCQTDFLFEYINENILRTDVNANGNRVRRVRISDLQGACEGVTTTTNLVGGYSIFYFLQQAVRRAVQQMRWLFTDDDGLEKELTGQLIIRTIDITGPAAGPSTFNIQFDGAGDGITIDPVDPPVDTSDEGIDSDDWLMAESVSTITGLSTNGKSFAGKVILLVARTGAPYTLVSGTPGNLEAQVALPNINFLYPANPGGESIFVIWKNA